MSKKTLFALAAAAAAAGGIFAALKLLGGPDAPETAAGAQGSEAPRKTTEPDAPTDADQTVAFPLKNKYADYSRGENDPDYIFELDTPGGTKEIKVSAAHYDTYYIGDEVICVETGGGLRVV